MQEKNDILLKKQWFINTKKGKIEDYYDFDIKKILGSGSYGSVIKGTIKGSTSKRAIKVISKGKVKNPERFKLEIDIMKQLVPKFKSGSSKYHKTIRNIRRCKKCLFGYGVL